MNSAMLSSEAILENAWRSDLCLYANRMSGGKWLPYLHLRYIAAKLQDALCRGSARIVVTCPPRHGKSELCSYWLPTQYIDINPARRVILTSYGDSLAADFGRKVRDTLTNESLPTWAEVRGDTMRVFDWHTTEGGGMRTAGVGGPITGRGGDLIIVDDPHKSWDEACSPTYRQRVIDWFNSTLYTRAEPDASIIIIQTRWHDRDLAGYLLNEHSDKWLEIRLPAIAEAGDPLGRSAGQPLCPERYSALDLEKIKEAMGARMFAGLYQQSPRQLDGNMINASDIRHGTPPTEAYSKVAVGVDLAISTRETADYTAAVAIGKAAGEWWHLKAARTRAGFHGAVDWIMKFCDDLDPKIVGVESVSFQAAVVQELLVRSSLPVKEMKTKGRDKVTRFQPVAARYEARLINHALDLPSYYEDELLTFPNVEHDDLVDATAHAHEAYTQRFERSVGLAVIGGKRSARAGH